jgi:uroporphyrinogen-III synthase
MADEPKPLAGKRIVVTRALEQAAELVRALELLGAEVLLCPSLSFAPPDDTAPLDAAIRSLYNFDWLVLTSQNAARFFCARCRELGIDPAALAGAPPRVAAVGPATAEAARMEGLVVRHMAALHTGDALTEELGEQLIGKKVLLPRSDRAGPDLPAALRRLDARVTEVVAYRTLAPAATASEVLEKLLRGEADVAAFASPSAFLSFAEQIGVDSLRRISARLLLAAIGPVTAAAIRDAGFSVAVEASESTAAGLAAAIASFFSQRAPSGVIQQ